MKKSRIRCAHGCAKSRTGALFCTGCGTPFPGTVSKMVERMMPLPQWSDLLHSSDPGEREMAWKAIHAPTLTKGR